MKKLLLLVALSLFGAARASAQLTNVFATVTDPGGLAYAGGTVQVILSPPGVTSPCVVLNGNCQAIQGSLGPSTLDNTGSFSLNVYPNASIEPSGTQWTFKICIAPGVPPPLGTGPQCFSVNVTISGSSQSLSSTLSAAAPSLWHSTSASVMLNQVGSPPAGVGASFALDPDTGSVEGTPFFGVQIIPPGFNAATELAFGSGGSAPFAESALTVGLASPGSSNYFVGNAISAFASTDNTNVEPTAVYGQSRCIIGTFCAAFYGVPVDTAGQGSATTLAGFFSSPWVNNTNDVHVIGLDASGALFQVQPSSAIAYRTESGSSGAWTEGLECEQGSLVPTISFLPTGGPCIYVQSVSNAANSFSFPIAMMAINSSGSTQINSYFESDGTGTFRFAAADGGAGAIRPTVYCITGTSCSAGIALPAASSVTPGGMVLVADATSFTPGTCTGGGSDYMTAISNGTTWSCH